MIVYKYYSELASKKLEQQSIDGFAYARRYLQRNFANAISIERLASSIGLSRSALHEQFKKKMGISPGQYLMQLRLDSACKELTNNTRSIDEVAVSCGLRDKSYFSRVFKRKFGVTPGEYRKAPDMISQGVMSGSVYLNRANRGENGKYRQIENMGRVHRYYSVPRRVVCLDYSAAEICAALGIADRITGVASAEGSLTDCAKEYQSEIVKAPFLPAQSVEKNVPSFETVCSCNPELVIGTAYSFNRYGGVADAEDFEVNNIHVYALKATYTLGCDFESVYEDILHLGMIFKREEAAVCLINAMKAREAELQQTTASDNKAVRVFSFDTVVADKALTCGQALESYMIRLAGGINVFGDRQRQFAIVNWREVANANPEVILVHCFFTLQDGLQKVNILKRIPELTNTDAIRNNRIYTIGIKKVFPGIDNIETAAYLTQLLRSR